MNNLPNEVFTSNQVKLIERDHANNHNGHCFDLMQSAGQAVFDYITSDDGEAEDRFAKKLKEMVSAIKAEAERIGVVMTFEEELQHELRHNDSIWKRRLDEKETLLEQKTVMLEQKAASLEQKDLQLSEQKERIKKMEGIIADLQKQIEELKQA